MIDSPDLELAAQRPAAAVPATLPDAPRGMIDRGLFGFRGRRVLMLQGPIGPFFTRLARDLRAAGATVQKVDFNGGDRLFTARAAFDRVHVYRGHMADWPGAFERIARDERIDTILLFGDCRPIHVPAIQRARRLGIEIGVFEEGYLRPDYITIERDGTNHHSPMPKDPAFYRQAVVAEPPPTSPVGSTFGAAALWGMLYYCAASLAHLRFRHHVHHRPLGWRECRHWVRSGWRKLRYRIAERPVEGRFLGDAPVPFFLVVLQTHGDAQVRVHSPFGTVERFIEHVMRDFAAHAPDRVELVIKHHPLDRGYADHGRLIADLSLELGLAARCHYIHDQHLPTLLRKTLGVVTINSTVGLSAVGEGVPVRVCGSAIYDIPGLTFQRPLAEFWHAAPQHRPDFALWRTFRAALITTTQFNGSYYKGLHQPGNASGVFWDKRAQAALSADASPTRAAAPAWGKTWRPSLPESVARARSRTRDPAPTATSTPSSTLTSTPTTTPTTTSTAAADAAPPDAPSGELKPRPISAMIRSQSP